MTTTPDAASPAEAAVFVHPLAWCESPRVGAGTKVWAFSHVSAGAVVGDHCKIGEHSYIEDGAYLGNRVTVKNGALVWQGVHIEDDVFLGPRVTFTNDMRPRAFIQRPATDLLTTRVCRGASLGASVTVVCGTTIGSFALVGAGALVDRDVPAHALVIGVPARRVAWVCWCGDTLDDSLGCLCGRRFRDVGDAGLEEIVDAILEAIVDERPEPEMSVSRTGI